MEKEMLDDGKFVVGYKQTLKMLELDCISDLYIAQDADSYVTRHIKEYAKSANINVIPCESMKKLGKLCGIDVGTSVVAILK